MPENEVGLISRILSGSVIVFAGSLVNKFISFVGSIFIARTLGESGYGVVVVSLSVYFILTDALNLGLPAGVARNYPQAESDEERRGILVSSFVLGMSAGFVGGVVVFVSAHPISVHVFNDQSVAPVLQIIGLLIPLKVLFALSNGSIRAIKKPKMKVAVVSILQPIVRFVAIVLLVLAGFEAVGVAGAYTIAIGSTAVLSLYVVYKHTELFESSEPAESSYRSMLVFSLPLVGSSVIMKLMNNVDTLLLGSLESSANVGQYNVAFVLGMTTLLIYQSVGFMYIPEVSELYGDGDIVRADMIYTAMTKWVVLASIPFIITALLYPTPILTFIYSTQYTQASLPFVILVLGFLTHLFVGHNNNTLVAFGDTRELLAFDAGTVLTNLVLNLTLIPRFGIVGAAAATTLSYVLRNAGLTWYLNRTYSIQPFSRHMVLPVVLTAAVAGGVHTVISGVSISIVLGFTTTLMAVTAFGYLAYGIEKADIVLAELLEDDLGVNLVYVRKIHEQIR